MLMGPSICMTALLITLHSYYLHKPTLGAAAKRFGHPHRNFWRNSRSPFTNSDIVKWEFPSLSVASVMLKPDGSMQSRNTMPPGCGGFFIDMASSLQ